jgi:hypothetical protein
MNDSLVISRYETSERENERRYAPGAQATIPLKMRFF